MVVKVNTSLFSDSGSVIRAMSSLFPSVLRIATANCAILSRDIPSKPFLIKKYILKRISNKCSYHLMHFCLIYFVETQFASPFDLIHFVTYCFSLCSHQPLVSISRSHSFFVFLNCQLKLL